VQVNRHALTSLRERSGFTKSSLAREAGISVGTLHDIESGRRNASPEMIRRLAVALKVPTPALVGETKATKRRRKSAS
jgi:transcriptional regulator with XRE-family HTH domain